MDDEGLASAVIATLDVIDKDGAVTLPGAFGTQPVVVVPTHDWTSVPRGKGSIREGGKEAISTFKFNLESPTAKEWRGWNSKKGGMRRGSIG